MLDNCERKKMSNKSIKKEVISRSSFLTSRNAVAVIDCGISTQKICVVDSDEHGNPELLSFQRIFFSLRDNKQNYETFIKSLLRSYSDFGIRTFILTTNARPAFSSDSETVSFITDIVSKYVKNILCYTSEDNFVTIKEAKKKPQKVVSASWKAVAKEISNNVNEKVLIVEFSTRSLSLTLVDNGKILTDSLSNYERIQNDDLFYFGFYDTNVACIENPFNYKDHTFNLPCESHASTRDIFIITGDLNTIQEERNLSIEQQRKISIDNLAKVFSIDASSNHSMLIEIAEEMKKKFFSKIISIIKKKLDEFSLNKLILIGTGSETLYNVLVKDEGFKEYEILTDKDLFPNEFSHAYAVALSYLNKEKQ